MTTSTEGLQHLTGSSPRSVATANGRALGVVMLLVAATFWSVSGVAVKLIHLHPLAFSFWRGLFAAITMIPLVLLTRGQGHLPSLRWMAASVALYTAVTVLLITSMTVGTAGSGIVLQYTGPVFCALFALVFQGRRISKTTSLAMSIATLGVIIMVWGGWKAGSAVGPVCGLLSGIAFGALILVLEQTDRDAGGANPYLIVFFNNAGGALLTLPFAIHQGSLFHLDGRALGVLMATGAIQLAIPYALFQLALRRVKPVDASLLILLEPVLNPVWVALFTSERPDRYTLVGGVAVLIAMGLEAMKIQRDDKNTRDALPLPCIQGRGQG